jgi:hemerythrin
MAFLEWKEDYSVGIKKIDDQHKKLVAHLNDLFEAMKAGKGREVLDAVLNGLVQYTKDHFATEESLMKLYDFPDYEAHKQKHDKMAEHVIKLKQKVDSGEISNPLQITDFLKEWLGKHIMSTDKLYGPYLNQKGVR